MHNQVHPAGRYHAAMGRLLVLYTQVDQFIMETCAARVADAPSEKARLGLAKQVEDESRHVSIQQRWMEQFGVDPSPVIDDRVLQALQDHFAGLDWFDYLTDLYLGIEALGSRAVEEVVPLADPGTRESLRVPMEDELDHVTFGITELKEALAAMDHVERQARLSAMPDRIGHLVGVLSTIHGPILQWFEDVGADRDALIELLLLRQEQLLNELAA